MKFEKIITINDQSFETLEKCVETLMSFMKDYNKKNNLILEYFSIRTKDSDKNPFAIDMVLNWQVKDE